MTTSLIEIIIYNILITILSSGIIGFIVNHFIKIKIEQSIKHNYNKQLESIKQEYKEKFDLIQKSNDAHFSELKNTKDRYNSKQFEIYNNLWTSLVEVKLSADELWDSVTKEKLVSFSKKVSQAKKSIEIASLLLIDEDYLELNRLLNDFNDFNLGKELLLKQIKTANKQSGLDNYIASNTIETNRKIKEDYDALITQLKEKFKSQIQGNRKSGTN
ncbi:hypothetical protein ACOL21_04160 [Aliarcobacter butzleri]